MLRYPSRVLTRTPLMRSTMLKPTMHTSSRLYTDKILIGSCSAGLTCTTTLVLSHLLMTPLTPSIFAITVATAAASGACCVIDGGQEGGTTFGAVMGIFIGAIGSYYAKSKNEPWRK